MRKANPDAVRKNFIHAVNRVTALRFLVEDAHRIASRDLAELLMLATVVYWEGFVHDMFVAYVNRDCTTLTKTTAERISKKVSEGFGSVAANATTTRFHQHLSKAEVEGLLDKRGRNLAFDSADDMVKKCTKILPPDAAHRVGKLTTSDRAIIDVCIAIRNYLAHRSREAKARMDEALASAHLPVQLRRSGRRVHALGTFLAARVTAKGRTRAEIIFSSLQHIATRL